VRKSAPQIHIGDVERDRGQVESKPGGDGARIGQFIRVADGRAAWV
jgi:hypothetical protein